jgi:threonyl-tRNA synthetase
MPEERKTLEQRATMTDIERLRHSASHVLATAILELGRKRNSPPDRRSRAVLLRCRSSHRISPEDFEKIRRDEKSRRTILSNGWKFRAMKQWRWEERTAAALSDAISPANKIDIIENIPPTKNLAHRGAILSICAGRTSCAREYRCVQAHERRERLLQRRR